MANGPEFVNQAKLSPRMTRMAADKANSFFRGVFEFAKTARGGLARSRELPEIASVH